MGKRRWAPVRVRGEALGWGRVAYEAAV